MPEPSNRDRPWPYLSLAANGVRPNSARTPGDENELSSWSVGCVADLVDRVAVRDEVRLNFVSFTKAQCRVRRHQLTVRRKHRCRPEAHERAPHVGHLVPALDRSDAVDLGDA